jgi:serine/threonine protein kinase
MSPELVAKNPSNIRFNAATDIWSLGCVMKELCNLA